jgi:hypothetical protein
MFLASSNDQELFENFETIGLKSEIQNKDILIKINLARMYVKNHPRTDMSLLKTVVEYIYQNGGKCAIAEASDGFLQKNLIASGFDDMLKRYGIKVIDVDLEDCDEVISHGEHHFIPECFREYPVRIAIPAASKRKSMLYSNNVKLFFGAVPRKMYQLDDADIPINVPRPKLHQNLHTSIVNLYFAIKEYAPFHFYINGGLAFNEKMGEFLFAETYTGNEAFELDFHIFQTYFIDCEYPDYLDIIKNRYR